MARLSIVSLGAVRVELDSQPLIRWGYDKVLALLIYLAMEADRPHRREALADLLWPELAADAARLNLRQALFTLRRALRDQEADPPFLLVERDTLRFNRRSDYRLDALALAAPLPTCPGPGADVCDHCAERAGRVLEAYGGAFLRDFTLPGCPDFEAWATAKREMLHQRALIALERLSACRERCGDTAAALRCAQRYVELEPWDEGGHRRVMRLLARSGQVGAAVAQFETCRRILESELDTAPSEPTRQLLRRIRDGEEAAEAATAVAAQEAAPAVGMGRQRSGTSATAERRQVTALYCELTHVGSTDPEEAGEMLRGPEEHAVATIRQRGGYLRRLHGGGLIAYFGYPEAHEEAARRAVQAALAIVGELAGREPALGVRVGVHAGVIITHEDPELLDAAGVTSHGAIALCNLARRGEVVISAATLRLVEGYFVVKRTATRGDLPATTDACRVMAESGAIHRLEAAGEAGLTPLVGREAEIARLLAYWREARGRNLRAVLVTGEPGIGKSRLVQAIRERLADACTVRELHCQAQLQSSALYPIIDLMQRLAGFEPGDAPATRVEKLRRYLEPFYNPSPEVMALLAPLLGLAPPADAPAGALPPRRQKEMTQQALLQIVQARARRLPTLWILEDLHWADPSTLELIGLVLERAEGESILALLTARPEFDPPWAVPYHLHLGPLSAEETVRMIRRVAGDRPLPQTAVGEIARITDGIPLFIEEMTRSVLESSEGGEPTASAVPTTLHDLLMARLDRLGEARRLAQLGATIGREFGEELLAALATAEPEAVQRQLRRMVEERLLSVRETGTGRVYQFRHVLVQEAAYQTQLKRDRQAAHRRIAELLRRAFAEQVERQPELLAHHLTGAGETRQAVEEWLRAGQRALARHAHVEAVAHLDTGLKLLAALPAGRERDRLELELRLAQGASLLNTKGYGAAEVQQTYARAMALCQETGEADKLFQTLWGLFMGASTRSGYPEAKEIARQMLRLAESRDDPQLRIGAHYAMGNALFWSGEFAEALTHQERAVAAYTPRHDEALILRYGENPAATSLSFMAWSLWFLGYPDRAVAKMREAVAFARARAHPPTLALALTFTAMLHRLRGEPQETRAAADEVLALAGSGELMFWMASGLALQGWARVMQGEADGIGGIERSLEGMRRTMGGAGVSFLTVLAEARAQRREPQAALAALTEAQSISEAIADRYFEAELHRLKGECLLMISGDQAAEAEACFRQALAISRRQSARMLELRAAMGLVRLHRAQGRADAEDELAEVYGRFTEGFATVDLTAARELLQPDGP